MTEKNFVDGMRIKDAQPDFVLCKVGVKIEDFMLYAKANEKKGWLNFDIKRSKGGKLYAELDTWEPNNSGDNSASFGNAGGSDVPF